MSKQPTGASRGAAQRGRARTAAPNRSIRDRGGPSLLAQVQATRPLRERWDFTPEQRAEIDEVFAADRRGEVRCGCKRLAVILKTRYDLPWSVTTIRDRLEQIKRESR